MQIRSIFSLFLEFWLVGPQSGQVHAVQLNPTAFKVYRCFTDNLLVEMLLDQYTCLIERIVCHGVNFPQANSTTLFHTLNDTLVVGIKYELAFQVLLFEVRKG